MTVQRVANRTLFLALIVVSALPLGACMSSQSASAPDYAAVPRGALLTVENRHTSDMRVYFVRDGMRQRLGALSTGERRTFTLHRALLGPDGEFRVGVEALASREAHLSPWIQAAAGDRILYTVAHRLRLSAASVHPR